MTPAPPVGVTLHARRRNPLSGRGPGEFKVALLSPSLIEEPLGSMYIGSALRRAGYDVTGILINAEGRTAESVIDEVVAWNPDVVAIGVITGEHLQCLDLSRRLAERHDHFTVLGGPFLTFAPETIRDHAHLDAIARGECENAMVELCDRLRSGSDHTDLHNFWFRVGNSIVENPLGPLPVLDELPFPDRLLFGAGTSDGVYNIVTSRGCPYKCTYCFNDRFVEIYRPTHSGGQRSGTAPTAVVRSRSISSVIDELRFLVESFDVQQFNFQDDIFPIRNSRTLEFCDAYRAAGLTVPWSCSVKAELLDQEVVEAMAAAGCNKAYMGVEAADDSIRNEVLLRRVDREEMIDAAALIRASGIELYSQSMVGLPGTSFRSDLDTMRFNALLRPAFAWVSIFTPYPGTALADRAHELGLVDPDFMATMPNTYHYRSILDTPHAPLVSNLHKLFSLGVEHPELADAIEAFLARSAPEDLDPLHRRVFLPFRRWKHDQLRSPAARPDTELVEFISALSDDDISTALAVIRTGQPEFSTVCAGPGGPWVHRDGVDATVRAATGVSSADRRAAEP